MKMYKFYCLMLYSGNEMPYNKNVDDERRRKSDTITDSTAACIWFDRISHAFQKACWILQTHSNTKRRPKGKHECYFSTPFYCI